MKFLGNIDSPKTTLAVVNVGAVSTNQVADFSTKGYFTYTIGGNIQLSVSNLAVGQRGSLSLLCDGTGRTISWVGINNWIGGVMPTLTPSKLCVVSLFNDGVRILASYGTEL